MELGKTKLMNLEKMELMDVEETEMSTHCLQSTSVQCLTQCKVLYAFCCSGGHTTERGFQLTNVSGINTGHVSLIAAYGSDCRLLLTTGSENCTLGLIWILSQYARMKMDRVQDCVCHHQCSEGYCQ